MRLLKQDKRRRGETIGKLLRCLDEMKDNGKLDETKLTDGRMLLAATVTTRGWSMEDRIYAAVEAMESERGKLMQLLLFTGSEAQSAGISEADFTVFRPAGATRCNDGGEIWHGGGDRASVPNFTLIGATIRV